MYNVIIWHIYDMPLIHEIEQRLRVYREFLANPPERGSFDEDSYERNAYRVALGRALDDAERLLAIVKTLIDYDY